MSLLLAEEIFQLYDVPKCFWEDFYSKVGRAISCDPMTGNIWRMHSWLAAHGLQEIPGLSSHEREARLAQKEPLSLSSSASISSGGSVASRVLVDREKWSGFCWKLPKVELHAHLNGSVRDSTVRDLLGEEVSASDSFVIENGGSRSLAECFQMFSIIHRACGTLGAVERIAQEMVEDCALDGVVYLEMRTTPKEMPSKVAYMEAVFRGITEAQRVPSCGVGVLMSIDRGRDTFTSAMVTVGLAMDFVSRGKPVVGIDFSGDPKKGDVGMFIPVLRRAQELGLKISVHLAEVESGRDEILEILRAGVVPDRIGHGVFLSGAGADKVKSMGIPIEMCLTSNVKTQSCLDYSDHHMRDWLEWKHPVCLCTDDSGIFGTCLSRECQLAMEFLGIDRRGLVEMQRGAAGMAFCSDSVKSRIVSLVDTFVDGNVLGN